MIRPKLRKLERHPLDRGDERLLVLRDPLGLAEPVALPAEAAPVLDLLDGKRNPLQIRQSLLLTRGVDIPADDIEALVTDLGDAGLLDDDRFRDRWSEMHTEFLEQAVRPSRLAGLVYPADPAALAAELEAALPDPSARTRGDLLAVVCPYQPFEPTAALLDSTLRDLPSARELDLILVLGTDHGPGMLPYVITDKPYATPLGVAPSPARFASTLAGALPWVLREEIRHRDALSLEIATVLLHHLYGRDCPPILSVLCGSTVLNPRAADRVDEFLAQLERLVGQHRVLIWASAELGHVGEAYGTPPVQETTRDLLEERDRGLLNALCHGHTQALRRRCLESDELLGRASGSATFVTLATLLPIGFTAELAGYVTRPAPGDDGWAGLAGLRFHAPR
ncbi:MAG: AmmeMemoRadiSam system protein B [Nannocystaceae bacterium]